MSTVKPPKPFIRYAFSNIKDSEENKDGENQQPSGEYISDDLNGVNNLPKINNGKKTDGSRKISENKPENYEPSIPPPSYEMSYLPYI